MFQGQDATAQYARYPGAADLNSGQPVARPRIDSRVTHHSYLSVGEPPASRRCDGQCLFGTDRHGAVAESRVGLACAFSH